MPIMDGEPTSAADVLAISGLAPTLAGWLKAGSGIAAQSETWVYASANSAQVNLDVSKEYLPGDKIRLVNSSTKYFYVISTSVVDDGNGNYTTTINLTGGSDYALANAAISQVFFSRATHAYGFPEWFNWAPALTWTAGTAPSGSPTASFKFAIIGNTLFIDCRATSYTAGATVTVLLVGLPPGITALAGIGSAQGWISTLSTAINASQAFHTTSDFRIYCNSCAATAWALMAAVAF